MNRTEPEKYDFEMVGDKLDLFKELKEMGDKTATELGTIEKLRIELNTWAELYRGAGNRWEDGSIHYTLDKECLVSKKELKEEEAKLEMKINVFNRFNDSDLLKVTIPLAEYPVDFKCGKPAEPKLHEKSKNDAFVALMIEWGKESPTHFKRVCHLIFDIIEPKDKSKRIFVKEESKTGEFEYWTADDKIDLVLKIRTKHEPKGEFIYVEHSLSDLDDRLRDWYSVEEMCSIHEDLNTDNNFFVYQDSHYNKDEQWLSFETAEDAESYRMAHWETFLKRRGDLKKLHIIYGVAELVKHCKENDLTNEDNKPFLDMADPSTLDDDGNEPEETEPEKKK